MITIYYFFFLFSSWLIFEISCQTCRDTSQYKQCSTNSECGCFQLVSNNRNGLCASLELNCSQFSPCETANNTCQKSNYICVHHPRCSQRPFCYPLEIAQKLCPLKKNSSNNGICARATWSQNATTIAGGNGQGSGLDQLNYPFGLFLDTNQSIYIADSRNNRIIKWDVNATRGEIVAGTGGSGAGSNELDNPQDIVVDKNGTLYISDTLNGRIQQWYRGATSGQTIVGNIAPIGLAQDNQGSIYATDYLLGQVIKWNINGTSEGVIISNLSFPYMLFVDQNQSIYVADSSDDRIIRVDYQTKNISIVAGGSGGGNLSQLSWPEGIVVDQLDNVYVVDSRNHRIIQWSQGATTGNVIAGGHGAGPASNQLYYPSDLAFDSEGNLLVVDNGNHRVQKFLINKSLC